MQKRRLGRSSLEFAPLVLGGNVFGWTADAATSHRVLDAFVDAGFNAVDTADAYSAWVPGHTGGESEAIIGDWLAKRGRRDDVLIFTKVGWELGPDRKGLSAAYITSSIEGSLKRLKTDYVDLYQSHVDDKATPFEETLGAYARLIEQGKVRAIGASNIDAARLKEALETSGRLGLPRYESVQPPYNLYSRSDFEAELQPLCQSEQVGAITYYGLASGFLTGKYRSEADLGKSARGGGVKKYLNDRGLRVLAALDEAADRLGATQAQVALAWLMARPGVTAPIASATSVEQLNDIVGAARLKLDPELMGLLDAASA
ncbi:aldo/keto reductase [Caulobacter sp. 17J65-9]|uniref:aldo/keto reductase n=1 Tax=Caulobacter sp. 17J65-9 TaxID=2709382 RepID=UPI0013C73BF3|nr:aldo/keto reductase [Caulobacter sp. 17J65-9]NEX93297.1 aldo/keto reductase [Caulobacter sp. 17J65-9]